MSFNVSKKLYKNNSRSGKVLIKEDLNVSRIIMIAINEIIKTSI